MTSIKTIAQSCLNKSPNLSIRQDILGVYGNDNAQTRSVKAQLNLIENKPFVRVALVTITGAAPLIQRDLDTANEIYQRDCDAWIYPTESITVTRNNLLVLDQDDCRSGGHSVSDEEDELFDIGRNLGADVVCYYINTSNGGFAGCAAHPNNRRGFWVGSGASPRTWAHELSHVVGDNRHVSNSDNLMSTPTASITNLPADLSSSQCDDILDDPDVESC